MYYHLIVQSYNTVPRAKKISGKNAQAWVSMVSNKKNNNENIKEKNPGSRLGFAC